MPAPRTGPSRKAQRKERCGDRVPPWRSQPSPTPPGAPTAIGTSPKQAYASPLGSAGRPSIGRRLCRSPAGCRSGPGCQHGSDSTAPAASAPRPPAPEPPGRRRAISLRGSCADPSLDLLSTKVYQVLYPPRNPFASNGEHSPPSGVGHSRVPCENIHKEILSHGREAVCASRLNGFTRKGSSMLRKYFPRVGFGLAAVLTILLPAAHAQTQAFSASLGGAGRSIVS